MKQEIIESVASELSLSVEFVGEVATNKHKSNPAALPVYQALEARGVRRFGDGAQFGKSVAFGGSK
jgi:hypothetical protein